MFTVFGSPDPTIEDEPRRLQFFLVATREDVQTTINQLQVLRFCERIHWSPPIPVLGSDWQYIMMQRDRSTLRLLAFALGVANPRLRPVESNGTGLLLP